MGALTNKPMAFNSRNWEYNTQVTKDLTDFLSPRIRVDQFSGKIYRILPTVEWISNKIRFLYLGLKNQRIVTNLSTYKLVINFNLNSQLISFEKKTLINSNFEKVFSLLANKIFSKKKTNINVILGNIFNSNLNSLYSFENKNTKITAHFELEAIKNYNKFPDLLEKNNCFLFGVNPRMESPLLNLQLKEKFSDIYSLGNYSFSFPVKVLSNNLNISTYKLMARNSLLIFGLSSLQLYDVIKSSNKMLLLPLYYFNNIINYSDKIMGQKKIKVSDDDVNIFVAAQNIIKSNNNNLNLILTTHFEKLLGISGQNIRIPLNNYLESSISFFNKDLKLEKINSLKPGFNLSDFFSAFNLYISKKKDIKNFSKELKGNLFETVFKTKVYNKLISNSIPNYLVRDPLSRANPLFLKA